MTNDKKVTVQVRLPEWLKTEVIRLAKKEKVSQNTLIVELLWQAIQDEKGLPTPPPAVAPIPTATDLVIAESLGRTVLEPCGVPAPCARQSTFKTNDFEYCSQCRIRVS